jgi:hypothetical protein
MEKLFPLESLSSFCDSSQTCLPQVPGLGSSSLPFKMLYDIFIQDNILTTENKYCTPIH